MDDYEDLCKMMDELKAIHKQFLPPIRIERGYEIVGLEIVDILQDMALEAESGRITQERADAIIAEHADVGIKVVQDGDVLRVVEPTKEPVEAEAEIGSQAHVELAAKEALDEEIAQEAKIEALKAKLAELKK